MNTSPAGGIDARGDRVVQSFVGVVLLGAFVFRIPLLVPIVGVVLLFGAGLGSRANPLLVAYVHVVAPRLAAPDALVDPRTARRQDVLLAGLCTIAALAFLIGISPVGWLFVIAAALIAIIAATTSLHVGDQLQRFTTR